MKWYGEIGFREEVETSPRVWRPTIVPMNFYGDVLSPSWREQQGSKINADMQVSNRISVVANSYIQTNLHKIAYITFGGAKWTVSSVEQDPDRPRLTFSLGPLYLEETDED